MKKFKKLIPALCMLLVSAIMLGGSTFAWFSMNDKVTATGMSVTAKTNTQFLVISKTATMATETDIDSLDIAAGYGISVGATKNNVYPVAYAETATKVNVTADGQTVTEQNVAKDSWYTAHSPKYNSVFGDAISGKTNVVTNFKTLNEAIDPSNLKTGENVKDSLASYALKYTAYIGLADDSEDATGTFTVTANIHENGSTTLSNEAIKVLVIIDGKNATGTAVASQRLVLSNEDTTGAATNTTKKTTTADVTLKAKKTGDASATAQIVTVTIYVFIDGNSDIVKDLDSDGNLMTLSGVVDLTFKMNGIAN